MSTLKSGEVLVIRKVHFNAAHRLHNERKAEDWNRETYGPCNNPRWHGHNYDLEVSVAGVPDPETGYVIDLKELKSVIDRKILSKCDHANLNEQVDFLTGIIPTAENLAIAFWKELEPEFGSRACRLFEIKLFETPRNVAVYRG